MTHLVHAVAVSQGDGVVLESLAIDSETVGRPDFIHPAISPTDGSALVVEDLEFFAQIIMQFSRHFRHAVFFDQRQDGRLIGRYTGMQAQDHPLLALDFFFIVGIDQAGQQSPVASGRGFNDVGNIFFLCLFVPITQVFAREFFVARQVEVGPVVDTFQLFPAEGELVFDVIGLLGVMGQVAGTMFMPAEIFGTDAEVEIKLLVLLFPISEPFGVFRRMNKELHLHLFEFAGAEDEIPRRDFVAESLADLGYAKGYFLA